MWDNMLMVDLGIDLSPRGRGRASKPISMERGRDLTPADLALLETEKGIKAPAVKQLRDRHHALARMIATGMSEADAAAASGYVLSRVSILKSDPAFEELVSFYRGIMIREEVVNAATLMTANHRIANEEMQERLVTDPESFDNKDLLEVIKVMSDRIGLGPQTKSTNVNLNVDIAARMAAGRERAAKFSQSSVPSLTIDENGEPVT